jgi:hypothetical protein
MEEVQGRAQACHAWLNVARLHETIASFESLVSFRDFSIEQQTTRFNSRCTITYLSAAFILYVNAVQGFFSSLNQMAAQEPHHTFHHLVHGTIKLEEYLRTQALTDELEHICNMANAYVQTQ